MKIVAVSDLHGNLPTIPPCDLLLIAGDICPVSDHSGRFQSDWLDHQFREWLRSLTGVGQVVGVAGNHDFIFQREPERVPPDLGWTYLEDSGAEVGGLRIWGTPWQPWFYDWAFNLESDELREKWALIPDDTDILVVHGPPLGYGDAVPRRDGNVENCGCPHLLERILQVEPKLVVFGHIHEGRGQWQIGPSLLANVTLLDVRYRPVFMPLEIDLPT